MDLGTFSALTLIAEVRGNTLIPLFEEALPVDLKTATARSTRLGNAAVARARNIVARFDKLAPDFPCNYATVVCTAAIRNATNRIDILKRLTMSTNFPVIIVSAKQEALLSAAGALTGIRKQMRAPLVVDVGGGSAEFVDPTRQQFTGIRIGAARATDQWASGMPHTKFDRIDYFRECARLALAKARLSRFVAPTTVVGVGGTLVTLAAIKRGLHRLEPSFVHGMTLTRRWIDDTAIELATMSRDEIAALIPFDPKRARVLKAGTFLWSVVCNRLSVTRVVVSARGLRWGAALRLAFGPRVRGIRPSNLSKTA